MRITIQIDIVSIENIWIIFNQKRKHKFANVYFGLQNEHLDLIEATSRGLKCKCLMQFICIKNIRMILLNVKNPC